MAISTLKNESIPTEDPTSKNDLGNTVSTIINKQKEDSIPKDLTSNLDYNVNNALLSNTELTDLAGDKAKQLMTGEIPADLKNQIESISQSKAMRGGFGMGEAGRKLEARDLGLTSMQLVESGANIAAQVTQAQNQTTQIYASLQESERNYQLALGQQNVSQANLALMGTELISKNQQYASSLLNELIIQNSHTGIDNVQDNVDALIGNTDTGQAGYFDSANNAINDIINQFK